MFHFLGWTMIINDGGNRQVEGGMNQMKREPQNAYGVHITYFMHISLKCTHYITNMQQTQFYSYSQLRVFIHEHFESCL